MSENLGFKRESEGQTLDRPLSDLPLEALRLGVPRPTLLPNKASAKIRTFSARYKCFFRANGHSEAGKGKEARNFFRASSSMLQL